LPAMHCVTQIVFRSHYHISNTIHPSDFTVRKVYEDDVSKKMLYSSLDEVHYANKIAILFRNEVLCVSK
jgi:uncharacterized metal-binding protein